MERIETINQFLTDNFGVDTITGQPIYRVVWADDQYENRLTKFTDSGVEMLSEELRLLPKYPWCNGFYILEQLTVTPEINLRELAGNKIAYNILHKFMGANELPVPPAIWACKFIIDTVNAAMGKSSLASYVHDNDPDPTNPVKSPMEMYDFNKQKIDQITNELFGDESGLKGMTIDSGSAIIVPQGYNKES